MNASNPLRPAPPFLWPEQRVHAGLAEYDVTPAWRDLLKNAHSLSGVVADLRQDGVDFLADALREHTELRCSLVVVLYPACATGPGELEALVRLSDAVSGRLELRVFLLPYIEDVPHHSLMLVPKGSASPLLLTGPAGNFGLEGRRPDRVNLVTSPDSATVEAWRRWFDWLWATYTVRLRADTVAIPRLVRPQGTPEARRMWEDYMAACDNQEERDVEVAVDQETGDVRAVVSAEALEGMTTEDRLEAFEEAQSKLPSAMMGVPRLDPTADKVARLYALGRLTSIDVATRLKPLKVPLSPRFFGDEGQREEGSVSRETRYAVSIFSKADQKKIEDLRTSAGKLLTVFSYPLSDGVRWLPDAASPLLRAEFEAREKEAREVLSALFDPSKIDEFVASIERRLRDDSNRMFQSLYPGKDLDDTNFARITDAVKERLRSVGTGSLLPQLTSTRVSFDSGAPVKSSPWGGAYHLLLSIAKFPAEVAKNWAFYARNFAAVEVEDILKAKDVLGHAWMKPKYFSRLSARPSDAKEHLDRLGALDEQDIDSAKKCAALLALIETGDWKHAESLLQNGAD